MKLVVTEPESPALFAELDRRPRRLMASWLLHAELHCAAGRRPETIDQMLITALLKPMYLADLTRADLLAAATHTPLRANDAIHLAVALRLGVDEFVTYDQKLADAATKAGLCVLAPA